MPKKRYRPNVAMFVLNRAGEILTCERSDYRDSWQLPQGGAEDGEELVEAAFRELYEEIGTQAATLLERIPGTFRYDWPKRLWRKGYCGQEQVFFILRISPWAKIDLSRASQRDPQVEQEFRRYEFLSAKDFLRRVNGFKKASYKKALSKALEEYPELFKVK
jgi:putative (di)nucleoside polyphosphate hydrolase